MLSAEDKTFIGAALDEVRQETVDHYSVTISDVPSADVVDEEFESDIGGGSPHTRKVDVPLSPTNSDVPVNIIDINSLMLATSPRFTPHLEVLREEGLVQDVAYVIWINQSYAVKLDDQIVYDGHTYTVTRVIPDEIGIQSVLFVR